MNNQTTRAIYKQHNIEYNVRKMSDDEIDNSDGQRWVSDETGHIFREDELRFLDTTPPLNR